jgi:hypothetical protein
MSDVSQGPGWWQASDGKWYAPEQMQQPQQPPPPVPNYSPQAPVPAPSPYPSQMPPQTGPQTYAAPGYVQKVCPGCSTPLMASAAVCPRCGTPVAAPRSKGVAILLAVFLSFWTWLYTYKRDAQKFWIGLAVAVVGGILSAFFIGIPIVLGVWIWAIVDVARKSDSYYMLYPSGA